MPWEVAAWLAEPRMPNMGKKTCHVDGEALMKPREIVETDEMGRCFSNLGMVLNEKKDGFVMNFS